jgi:hypothetical protein
MMKASAFTKTGSGQTQGKLKRERTGFAGDPRAPAEARDLF